MLRLQYLYMLQERINHGYVFFRNLQRILKEKSGDLSYEIIMLTLVRYILFQRLNKCKEACESRQYKKDSARRHNNHDCNEYEYEQKRDNYSISIFYSS